MSARWCDDGLPSGEDFDMEAELRRLLAVREQNAWNTWDTTPPTSPRTKAPRRSTGGRAPRKPASCDDEEMPPLDRIKLQPFQVVLKESKLIDDTAIINRCSNISDNLRKHVVLLGQMVTQETVL